MFDFNRVYFRLGFNLQFPYLNFSKPENRLQVKRL